MEPYSKDGGFWFAVIPPQARAFDQEKEYKNRYYDGA